MDSVFVPGALGLLEDLDKKLVVVLKDGRTLIGILRSIDQFSNLVLQDTIERIYVGKEYGDINRGIYLIRGENIVLLGEVTREGEEVMAGSNSFPINHRLLPRDLTRIWDDTKDSTSQLKKVPVDVILEAQNEEQRTKEELSKTRNKARLERGLPPKIPDGGQGDFV